MRAMKRAAPRLRRVRTSPVLERPIGDADTSLRRGSEDSRRPAITLGNFDALVTELNRLYRNMRIWITEYGYQTNPPDGFSGVTTRSRRRT